MDKTDPTEDKINQLKKEISILEWDLSKISNPQLKTLKEGRLNQYKQELEQLRQNIKIYA